MVAVFFLTYFLKSVGETDRKLKVTELKACAEALKRAFALALFWRVCDVEYYSPSRLFR